MMSKKHKNWQLASLAVHVKLDAFTKVKAAMDKMLVELKAQQKAEYEKWETCKKDIDTTEDKIWNGKVQKRDLATAHKDVVNARETGLWARSPAVAVGSGRRTTVGRTWTRVP